MAGEKLRKRLGFKRSAIREDLVQFALPGIILWIMVVGFSGGALSGFWRTMWGLVKHPRNLLLFPVQSIIGLALFSVGLIIMCFGQFTLFRNYSGTVVIREGHQLVTHGIYRFTRNPMYLGGIMAVTGLPVYATSLPGFLTSLVLIPVILNRIRLEERLLEEEFQDAYRAYKKSTKRLVPFIY